MTLVVNLFGGPGSGKSTTAAGVFYELKTRGVNCEYVTEYAKDLTWEKNFLKLKNQLYVLANQYHRIWRCADQVDVIITDSPILLSAIYGVNETFSFEDLVHELFDQNDNLLYYLNRTKPYTKIGRNQDEAAAKELDKKVKDYLDTWYTYTEVPSEPVAVDLIVADVIYELENNATG